MIQHGRATVAVLASFSLRANRDFCGRMQPFDKARGIRYLASAIAFALLGHHQQRQTKSRGAAEMTDPNPTRRRFCPTPAWLVLGLLAVEGLLWLSERFQWFAFNQHKGWTVLIAVASVGVAMILMLLWFAVARVFRWRFQFSIRSLLVLTVAVAVPFSWLAVEMKKASEQKAAVEAIRKIDRQWASERMGEIIKEKGFVMYDWQESGRAQPPAPAWLQSLLGDDFFADVASVDLSSGQLADADLACLEGLPQIQSLYLNGTTVTDAGLPHLEGLSRLQMLNLSGRITDAGLEPIGKLGRLQTLCLDGTKVAGTGLKHLKGLTQLRVLVLSEYPCRRRRTGGPRRAAQSSNARSLRRWGHGCRA